MELLSLVQSLNEKERSYFRKYAQLNDKGEKAKFMLLFDELSKTERKAKAALEKKEYSPTNKLFLVNKILECLKKQQLHVAKHPMMEVKEILCYLPILLQKRLFKETRKKINKAKKKTIEFELFNDHLELLHWEKKLLWLKRGPKMESQLRLLLEEKALIKQRLEQLLAYQLLKEELNLLRVKDVRFKKAENKTALTQLIATPLLSKAAEPQLLSIQAQIWYHYLQTFICRNYYQDKQTAFIHAQKCYLSYENHPPLKKLYTREYKECLCLYSEVAYISRHFDEMKGIIQKIEQLIFHDGQLATDLLNSICFYTLLHAINTANQQEGERIIRVLEKYWKELAPTLRDSRQLAFFYNIFYFYVSFQQWKNASIWLDKMLSFKRTSDRRDIQSVARIWKMVLAYELELDLVNTIESAIKYLKRQRHYGPFEQCVVSAFKALNKAITAKEQQMIIQQLERDLNGLLTEQKQCFQQLGLQELVLWCQQ